MAQKKLLRFAQIKEMENVLEYPKDVAGKWHSFFKNQHPVTLELACGRGEYTVGLARMHPRQNYIGVDVKGNRMYIGAKTALQENLQNAAFLRTQIEMIAEYFSTNEVEEIWITFPDPQLRISKAKRRLTHPRFLRLYQQFLKPGGSIHLKTDSPVLHRFTNTVINMYGLHLEEESADVHAQQHMPELDIKTHYESLDIAKSKKIHYLRFSLPGELPDLDDALMDKVKETENNHEAIEGG
ncbi:MAG: tRNA (guanosine(46)-N7)-methyltransferase TrmB [Chitinophagaceae bacterium]|nr:MAG: tRNA (guanosine(46)-N7)-methyltransferase TrmB [Chitinophagaceae bacterium]